MKNRYLFIIFFLMTWVFGESQKSFSPEITIAFETGDYKVEKAIFYSSSDRPGMDKTAGFSLVTSGFNAKYYADYQQLFAVGECHVTEETFHSWKISLGQYAPVILANFILTKGSQHFGITQYSLSHSGKEFLFAQAHKKINGRWYFLAFDENIELQPTISFFALVQEPFFNVYTTSPDSLRLDPRLFTTDRKLKGQELITNLHDKYKSKAPSSTALNLLFQNAVQPVQPLRDRPFNELMEYFGKTSMPADELEYLMNLLQALLPIDAIAHFTSISGVSLEKILTECPNALTQ